MIDLTKCITIRPGLFLMVLQGIVFLSVQFSLPAKAEEALAANVLTLQSAVEQAEKNDPWLVKNRHAQDSMESMSVAADTLPDPTMSIALANLPVDTFEFDQEAMTQFKVGVTQMFPRGDILALKSKQLKIAGSQNPYQRIDRKAKIAVNVSQLWLEAYKAQESIALIEKDRPLFEQLADVAESSYASALGRTRQQDIIRAQVEITRLEDRLTMLKQKKETTVEQLSKWVSGNFRENYLEAETPVAVVAWSALDIDRQLPAVPMLRSELYSTTQETAPERLYEYFASHPAVTALDKKIAVNETAVEIARQSYKPEWGMNASYGYRDDGSTGGDRADFVSVGVTFDLPFFTINKQDKQVAAAVSQSLAVKTEKWMLVREMTADFARLRAQLLRLNDRRRLYQEQLLPQMNEQAEASLTAYTNDDGDFAEVVRARIAELNSQISALEIDVERQKTIVQLNYYFMNNAEEIIASNSDTGDKK